MAVQPYRYTVCTLSCFVVPIHALKSRHIDMCQQQCSPYEWLAMVNRGCSKVAYLKRTFGIKTTMTCCYLHTKVLKFVCLLFLVSRHMSTLTAQQGESNAQCCRGLLICNNALTRCCLLCRVAELELLRGHDRSEHDKLDRLEVCTQSLVKGLQLERDMVALCLHKCACSCCY